LLEGWRKFAGAQLQSRWTVIESTDELKAVAIGDAVVQRDETIGSDDFSVHTVTFFGRRNSYNNINATPIVMEESATLKAGK
jgi:hypothetical protein